MITPAQCRAARGLVNWSQLELAAEAEVSVVTIRNFEKGGTEPRSSTLKVIKQAFEAAGVIFVDENGDGPGVRLRKKPKPSSAK